MCVHDAEHDFKYSVFRVMVYVKYQILIQYFSGLQISYWSVVGWSVVSFRWSVGPFVGGRR